jgi:hypothetical protein
MPAPVRGGGWRRTFRIVVFSGGGGIGSRLRINYLQQHNKKGHGGSGDCSGHGFRKCVHRRRNVVGNGRWRHFFVTESILPRERTPDMSRPGSFRHRETAKKAASRFISQE